MLMEETRVRDSPSTSVFVSLARDQFKGKTNSYSGNDTASFLMKHI